MGRKKRKELKPWCWYCNREFDEEKVLIYHQKAKHFKCHICGKKLYTGPGLSIHCSQVHRHQVTAIPNALPHRCDPDIEIYGTEGIPFMDLMSRAKQKNVDLVLKEKNIANAALPAKYEKTLETPYGVTVERIIKPGSPSALGSTQHILKHYTPLSGSAGDSTCTPGDGVRQSNGSYNTSNNVGEYPLKINANKIQMPGDRTKIYYPDEDISLEEHRLRFSKYSKFDPDIKNQPQFPTPVQSLSYPPYPYYTPQIPQYPYPYTPTYQTSIPSEYVQPNMTYIPQTPVVQNPYTSYPAPPQIYATPPNYPIDSGQIYHQTSQYYPQ